MTHPQHRAVPVVLLALAAALLVAVQSPANAAVTVTSISSPANGTRYMIKNSAPAQPVTVAGTSNGTGGDLVDIRCYEIGAWTWQNVANNVPVQVGGGFSTNIESDDIFGQCRLKAVPDGYPAGASLATFSGPILARETVRTYPIVSGPNAGKLTDYSVGFQGARAFNGLGSATGVALWEARLGFADGSSSNFFWNGNAALEVDPEFQRNRLKVDGRHAFGPQLARSNFPDNVGLPALTFSAVRDAQTGVVTIKESNPIVLCPLAATWPLTEGNCPKFVPSGIRLDRSIIIKDGGLQVHVTDVWRSTDGKSHLVSPYYLESVLGQDETAGGISTPLGLKAPWVGKFTTFTEEVVYPSPPSLPASILIRDSNDAPNGSGVLPRGAITFDFPTKVHWSQYNTFAFLTTTFKVPPGGTRTTRHSLVMGTTDAAVLAKAKANEDRLD